ncbi:ATP-binding protein [Bosea sp. 117]|uniref:sensor histidine kinase n=1 Tax=Bosea sp. 117 TaxID=1125973 RepID=UPI0005703D4C|nr:ATP-binding protein [Bosea sp. 117]
MTARASRPLVGIVARRILLFAAIAMVAQLAAVLWEYGRDPQNLARLMLERETHALAGGLTVQGSRLGYELPPALAERYGHEGSGYVARLRTPSGVILFSQCDASCTEHFLPLDVNPPDFWLRNLPAGPALSFAGGQTIATGGHIVFIEVAIGGDPEHAVWGVLADEAIAHMVVPMSLTLVFVLGATLLSIRSALAPVAAAAAEADRLDPAASHAAFDTDGMPREIAQFARAVNRSYARLRELMQSQKLFTSAIAHEIRTPLAVISLELERIDHPRARLALEEVAELSRFVDQIVALARLEAVDTAERAPIALDALLEEVVASIAGWVYGHGASIALEAGAGGTVSGHDALLKDAVRNLVENAVRHGGPGVAIVVAAPEPGLIRVNDDGRGPAATGERPGGTGYYKRAGGLGIGLEIVRRIAALHGGSFELRPALGRGAVAEIRLPAVET